MIFISQYKDQRSSLGDSTNGSLGLLIWISIFYHEYIIHILNQINRIISGSDTTVRFHDIERNEKLKFYHKPEPRIHVIRLSDLIKVSKILPQTNEKARFLEGREEVHTGDTLPRAFSFL